MRSEMTRLAQQLPEYETVRAMYGVGETTCVQLMAEIGDVRRFPRRSSIVSFAGVDPAVDESGKPYFVYMTAAQNKFLRIYYARVKECLAAAEARVSAEN